MKLSDIASGTFLATTDKGEITFGNLTDAATQTHVAVLVPQNVPAGTELVRITLADASARPLAMRLPSQLSLEAGKKCVLNVTARRSGLELDNTKITPWTSSEQYDGEVSRYKKLDLSTLTADTRIIENVTAIGTTDYKLYSQRRPSGGRRPRPWSGKSRPGGSRSPPRDAPRSARGHRYR